MLIVQVISDGSPVERSVAVLSALASGFSAGVSLVDWACTPAGENRTSETSSARGCMARVISAPVPLLATTSPVAPCGSAMEMSRLDTAGWCSSFATRVPAAARGVERLFV